MCVCRGLAAAWAGGEDGREVTDRFLPVLARCLSKPHGIAYLLLLEDNKPREVAALLRERFGLHSRIVASRRAHNELLHIVRITWS